MDQQLIANHLLVRLSDSVLGQSHISSRLPSAFGFWICMLSVYALLRRRVAVPYALAAAILPAITLTWEYGLQARAYGVLLGAAACALACWQTAASGSRWRLPALAGVTLALTLALGIHMMALMLALPLAIGESLRSLERRRVDPAMWVAFALSAWPVLIYPKVLANAGFDLHGLYPRLDAIPDFYADLLGPAVFAMLLAALAAYLVGSDSKLQRYSALPRHLVAALAAAAAIPMVFIVVAYVTRHFFFQSRYGLLAMVGLAPLFAAGASQACRDSLRAGMAILVVIAGWAGYSLVKPALKSMPRAEVAFAREYPMLREAIRGDVPVVVANSTYFGLAAYYWPAADADRLHFVTDHKDAWRSFGEDMAQQVLLRAQKYAGAHGKVEDYSAFLGRNRHFLLYVKDDIPPHWLYYLLARDHCVVTLQRYSGNEFLFTVDVP